MDPLFNFDSPNITFYIWVFTVFRFKCRKSLVYFKFLENFYEIYWYYS